MSDLYIKVEVSFYIDFVIFNFFSLKFYRFSDSKVFNLHSLRVIFMLKRLYKSADDTPRLYLIKGLLGLLFALWTDFKKSFMPYD